MPVHEHFGRSGDGVELIGVYFFESPEMALTLGAVGKDDKRGKARLRRERSGFALFLACLRHDRENRWNAEK